MKRLIRLLFALFPIEATTISNIYFDKMIATCDDFQTVDIREGSDVFMYRLVRTSLRGNKKLSYGQIRESRRKNKLE